MQAVIAQYIFNKNGDSIPVCTQRKATGLFVLASFLFATMVWTLAAQTRDKNLYENLMEWLMFYQ